MPFLGCAGLVIFLLLRAEPSLQNLQHLAPALARFFDAHDFAKNFIGFAALAYTAHLAFAACFRDAPLRRAAVMALVVAALEAVQVFLPLRSSDWRDVAAGWLGVAAATAAWCGARPRVFPDGD